MWRPRSGAEQSLPTSQWSSCQRLGSDKDCFGSDKGVPELVEALAKVKRVVHFIRDRQKPLAIYRFIAKKALSDATWARDHARYGSAVDDHAICHADRSLR
jgi:hypothetical protein